MSISIYLRLGGPMLLAAVTTLCGTIQTPPADTPTATAVLGILGEKYNLKILSLKPEFPVRIGGGAIEGKEATADEIAAYTPLLSFEWNLYPTDLIKRTRLKRIVLCKELLFARQKR